jgi:hypothetical protein
LPVEDFRVKGVDRQELPHIAGFPEQFIAIGRRIEGERITVHVSLDLSRELVDFVGLGIARYDVSRLPIE